MPSSLVSNAPATLRSAATTSTGSKKAASDERASTAPIPNARSSISANHGGCGLAASDGYLYWSQDGAIARANLQGGEVEDAFIPEAGGLDGIAVQAGPHLWAASRPGGSSSIGRANLDGSGADPAWIPSGELELGGVAVDERPAPPSLALPSRPIRLVSNVQYNLRSGAVLLGVYVPPQGPLPSPSPPQGQLAVTSPGLSWKVFTSTALLPSQGGSSLWQVRICSGSGAVGRGIRAQLRRRGWARVTVRLSYTQERVYPVEVTRKLILVATAVQELAGSSILVRRRRVAMVLSVLRTDVEKRSG